MVELPKEQLNLLVTIHDVLRTQDRWPTYIYLEHLFDTAFDINIEELARSLPPDLTTFPPPRYPPHDQQEIQLTIEGLRHVPDAATEAELFFRVFRRFVELQKSLIPTTLDNIPMPCLTTDELSKEWAIDPATLKRVFRIVTLEPWTGSTATIGDGSNVQICASRVLRRFRQAQTLDQYIDLRRAFNHPPRSTPPGVVSAARRVIERTSPPSVGAAPVPAGVAEQKEWDVFIAHASADKESFVRELAEALRASLPEVWYDDFTLKVGDSLRRKIDEGLAHSKYGIVVLSPHFFEREWPQTELDGLAQRQNSEGRKVILPVLHNITIDQVRAKSPTLAGLVAVSSDRGAPHVVKELLSAMDLPLPPESVTQVSTSEQRTETLVPDPDQQLPAEHYRETLALLDAGKTVSVERRARQLARRLDDSVRGWVDANRNSSSLPKEVRSTKQLESWEPIFKPIMESVRPNLEAFTAAATAAVEYDSPTLELFVAPLVRLFDTSPSSGIEWVLHAPHLVARVAAETLMARAVFFRRWQSLARIARPRLRENGGTTKPWVFNRHFIYLASVGKNSLVSGQFVRDQLLKDTLNEEIQSSREDLAISAADASVLMGVVYGAGTNQRGHLFWGYFFGPSKHLMQTLVSAPEALAPLAEMVGEDLPTFRKAFATRFAAQVTFLRQMEEFWLHDTPDEIRLLVNELSQA